MSTRNQHPMAVVSRKTGVRPDLLRAWERRHQAVTPARSSGNRRLYSDDDVRRITAIRRALDGGWQIGQVAALSTQDIEALGNETAADPTPAGAVGADLGAVQDRRRRCLASIERLDDEALRRELESASADMSRVALLEDVVVPLMSEIGVACSTGRMRTVHEHLASAVLRSLLDSMKGAYPPSEDAPTIVVTTPAFQHHELGALLVAATARIEGWRTTYLGPNLPAEEIAAACRLRRAQAVALSITFPGDDPGLDAELEKLGRLLEDPVQLLVGGRSAGSYRPALDTAGAIYLADLAELREHLRRVRRRPGTPTRSAGTNS